MRTKAFAFKVRLVTHFYSMKLFGICNIARKKLLAGKRVGSYYLALKFQVVLERGKNVITCIFKCA